MRRREVPQRVRNTQQLRQSGASGPHSTSEYNRTTKYPTKYIEDEPELTFFWESVDSTEDPC